MDGSAVKVFDPPRGAYLATIAEVLSCWDGRGVVIAKSDRGTGYVAFNLEAVLAFALVIFAFGMTLQVPALRRNPLVAFAIASLTSALVWHTIVDYGFFRDRNGVSIVASRYQQYQVPELQINQLNQMIDEENIALIDARTPIDYKRSHIPGALNLPITCTHGDIRETLAKVPKSKHVVVYCQSEQCAWADLIAQHVVSRGYQEVCIFRDGIEGWRQANEIKHDQGIEH